MADTEVRHELECRWCCWSVDAEMLYLNTEGLKMVGLWIGIRAARLERSSRMEVLRTVRSYVERSSDAEDILEGQVEFRRILRDNIRELMEEPDNWEQTPEHNRAVIMSGLSTSGEKPRTTAPA